jgi:hypothetical protein
VSFVLAAARMLENRLGAANMCQMARLAKPAAITRAIHTNVPPLKAVLVEGNLKSLKT